MTYLILRINLKKLKFYFLCLDFLSMNEMSNCQQQRIQRTIYTVISASWIKLPLITNLNSRSIANATENYRKPR